MTFGYRAGAALAVVLTLATAPAAGAAGYRLVGWNNLGMHCMDGDFAVLSLLPPFNTIHAQLVDPQGHLVVDPDAAGIRVTYEAVADPDGSINTTAAGKTNFWDHVLALFGAALPIDTGLAGSGMPGTGNRPQPMSWDAAAGWFVAAGIPITPWDDAGRKNFYPLMRLVARNPAGTVLATADVVLPVSDEMDCRRCHASGSGPAAQPPGGWTNDPDPERDVRLNVLRLHDARRQGDPMFEAALAAGGYDPAGLLPTAQGGRPILCAGCHASEALPGSGLPGIAPLTRAIHGRHADVADPLSGLTLDADTNRQACYRCHPGSETRCLRGAMGAAVAADGTRAMQCRSCHGSMRDVAAPTRTGWLDEPGCQSCHTGTATANAGQIRFLSVFDAPGHRRLAVDQTFATTPDAPAPGLSLYRFSRGHGGLACEACHGPTHAEYPSTHRNDNLQSVAAQGHVGALAECTSCHASTPVTVSGGPHGLHPLGASWVERHPDAVEQDGAAACRSCHGTDYRGTVLSRALGDRTLRTEAGTLVLWRGFQVGCYGCHRGPSNEDRNPNRPAVVGSLTTSTAVDHGVGVTLPASDADGDALVLRIVTQPEHGAVALGGTLATYVPDPGFTGDDRFTFAAWDGSIDSNLGTATVTVGAGGGTCTGRDLDGDGTPDTCDPVDASLTAVHARVRPVSGQLRVSGRADFQTAPPLDAFDASAGIEVAVTAGPVTVTSSWSAASCPATARGTIRCRSADGTKAATFAPVRRRPGAWRARMNLRNAGQGTPLGPVTVRVTHAGTVDRVGTATDCQAAGGGVRCR